MSGIGIEAFSLARRRILVTGASSGIGRACAVMASRLGAELVLAARRKDELERTLDMTENRNVHQIVPADLTQPGAAAEIVRLAGPCDGLVHAAGVSKFIPASVLSENACEQMMRVNVGAFMDLMKAFASVRNRRGESFSSVAVSSVSASVGWPGGTAYCATKGAVSAAVRALAVELAPQGVRVNSVSPSGIDTPLYRRQAQMNPEDAASYIAATQPLGLGKPEHVACAVCFLLSDAAAFVTGVDLPVDGGFLAK